MKHEELIDTSFNPNFEPAKNLIMQGLSYRLDPYEKSKVTKYTIELKPRKNYGQEMEKKIIENYAQNRQETINQEIANEKAKLQYA